VSGFQDTMEAVTVATPAIGKLHDLVDQANCAGLPVSILGDPATQTSGVLYVLHDGASVVRVTWFPGSEEKLEWQGIPFFWPGGRLACEHIRGRILGMLTEAGFHGYELRWLSNHIAA
jgi:hypothetical protein